MSSTLAAPTPIRPPSSLTSLLPALALALVLGVLAHGTGGSDWLAPWPGAREVLARLLNTGAALAAAVA
ncbi:MAG: hypothetical protein RL227_847 [Pseudomonadota bacterium]|jgi:hypothetical protein